MSLRLATKLASTSQFRYRLGAVITKGGRVLATGVNEIRYVQESFPKKHEESLHAEQAAILSLLRARRPEALRGATLFVSRINREGRSCMARPCYVCSQLILAVGIKQVFYTEG